MDATISGSRIFENLDASLEALQAGPPTIVVLDVDEGQERRIAVSILRSLPRRFAVQEFTFRPEALDFRAFLAASPEREGEIVFLFGLAGLSSPDRERAWRCLNMARESIRASCRSFVLFVALPHTDEFPLNAPDLRACVTAHFRIALPAPGPTLRDPLAIKPLPEVERLLRQAAYYESRITEPYTVPESRAAILRDYSHVLETLGEQARAGDLRAEADRLGGATVEDPPWVLQEYLEGILEETSVIRLSDLAVQVGQQILEIAFDDIWVPLRFLRIPTRQPVELSEAGRRRATGKVVSELLLTWTVRQAGRAGRPDAVADEDATVGEETGDRSRPSFWLWATREERKAEPISVEDVVRLGSVAVLGDPGTGKSTFLRWMARTAAKALLGHLDSNIPPAMASAFKDRVPILVHARLLAERLPATTEDPEVFLATACARTGATRRFLEGRLRAGRCLVLVDGLDEIPAPEERERIRSVLEILAGQPTANCIVATSRIVGYDLVRLGTPFEHVQLSELDDEGVRQFICQWYRTIAKVSLAPGDESPDQRAEVLFSAIAGNPGIRRIAGNPLLLTITALIHWRGGRLPAKRAAVYEAATRTLLDNWLARRPWVKLNADEMISVLSKIAFEMHERGESNLIPVSRLRQLFTEELAEARSASADEVRGEVDTILATLSQHSGLFLERGIGEDGEVLYGFLHLTFQEYLAALHLFQRWTAWVVSRVEIRRASVKPDANPIHPFLFDPRWQEVVLLAAGRASETSEALAATFLRGVIRYRDQYERILHRTVLMAARILADDVRVDKATAMEICSGLFKLLTKGFASLQSRAAFGIASRLGGTMYSGMVVEEILRLLGAVDAGVRLAATSVLGILKDPRALEPLLGRLEDENSDVRDGAAWALGELKDPRALEPLLALLETEDAGVRRVATRILGDLNDPRTLEPLVARLEDEDADVRRAATFTLGFLKDPRTLEPLLARLEDDDLSVRRAAAWALGNLNDPRTLERLLALLADENSTVRGVAAEALGNLNDRRALEPLLARLGDEDAGVRRAVAQALGDLNDPRTLVPLLARLEDDDLSVRRAAAWALGNLNDPRALEPLLARLEDKDSDVREAAIEALGGLKDPRALEPLLARLEDEKSNVREAAIEALGELKDPRALEPLLARLGDEDSGVRELAAWTLGELKDPRALEPLLARLGDEHAGVRGAAAAVLGDLKDPRAAERLTEIALGKAPARTQGEGRNDSRRLKGHPGISEAREALFSLMLPGLV